VILFMRKKSVFMFFSLYSVVHAHGKVEQQKKLFDFEKRRASISCVLLSVYTFVMLKGASSIRVVVIYDYYDISSKLFI
jgi:hypothetical protein